VPTGLAGNSNNGNMGEGIAANNGWADFVFEDDYTLMPVAELEAFIKKYKHLPNVPSAAQVQAEGIDLAEMNAILLRQIEELTLRIIELEARMVQPNILIGTWVLDSVINTSLGSNSQINEHKSKASSQVTLSFYADGTCTRSEDNQVENGNYLIDENLIQLYEGQTKNIKAEFNYRQVNSSKLYMIFKGSSCVAQAIYVFAKK
jgi:hypothetical protein